MYSEKRQNQTLFPNAFGKYIIAFFMDFIHMALETRRFATIYWNISTIKKDLK